MKEINTPWILTDDEIRIEIKKIFLKFKKNENPGWYLKEVL